MPKTDPVTIRLFDPETGVSELQAEVRASADEMVLDIPRQGGDGPYLIRGRRVNCFFAGRDEVSDAKPVDLVARWTKVGDAFVGIWIEEGDELLFTFRLPKNRTNRMGA